MICSHAKILAKKQRVRNLIFWTGAISRQDLIRFSGLSSRTVDKYTDELKRQRLILSDINNGGQGRPGIRYRSNSQNICFMGISLIESRLCFALIDINSYLLHSHVTEIPPDANAQTIRQIGFREVEEIKRSFPTLAVNAICFSYNTFLQPQKRISAFFELYREMQKQYGLQMEIHESPAILLQRLYLAMKGTGNMGYFLPGDEIRFHLVSDGVIREDIGGYLKKFRHYPLDRSSGMICSCGKKGCVEALLTYRAVIRRYYAKAGMHCMGHFQNPVNNINDLSMQGEIGDVHAIAILEENGRLIARAASILRKELHLEKIMISLQSKILLNSFLKEYQKLNGNCDSFLNLNGYTVSDAIFSAPEIMRLHLLEIHF